MSVLLAPLPRLQFGLDYAGYKLFTYAAGTVTKLNTLTPIRRSHAQLNPIILDANGSCACWLTPVMLYKFVLALPTDSRIPRQVLSGRPTTSTASTMCCPNLIRTSRSM